VVADAVANGTGVEGDAMNLKFSPQRHRGTERAKIMRRSLDQNCKIPKAKIRGLTAREICEELAGEVRVYRDSYREADGEIRNPGALRTIAALKAAIGIVKGWARD
jgi:hypothetical protein